MNGGPPTRLHAALLHVISLYVDRLNAASRNPRHTGRGRGACRARKGDSRSGSSPRRVVGASSAAGVEFVVVLPGASEPCGPRSVLARLRQPDLRFLLVRSRPPAPIRKPGVATLQTQLDFRPRCAARRRPQCTTEGSRRRLVKELVAQLPPWCFAPPDDEPLTPRSPPPARRASRGVSGPKATANSPASDRGQRRSEYYSAALYRARI